MYKRQGAYYERSEVKEFYEKFKNLRSVTGGELTIPTIVVDRILDILGEMCIRDRRMNWQGIVMVLKYLQSIIALLKKKCSVIWMNCK